MEFANMDFSSPLLAGAIRVPNRKHCVEESGVSRVMMPMDQAEENKEIGNQAFELQEWSAALLFYRTALSKAELVVPGSVNRRAVLQLKAECHANIALVLLSLDQAEEALRESNEAIVLMSTYDKAYTVKEKCLNLLGRAQEAEAAHKIWTKLVKNDAKMQNFLNSSLQEDNEMFTDLTNGVDPFSLALPKKALKAYQRLSSKQVGLELCMIIIKHSSALLDFARACSAKGDELLSAAVKLRLGVIIYKMHDFMNSPAHKLDKSWAQGKALFNKSDLLSIAQRDCFADVAEPAHRRGDTATAESALKLALPLDAHGAARCNLGLLYRDTGRTDLAKRHFRHAAEFGDGNACVEYGLMLYRGVSVGPFGSSQVNEDKPAAMKWFAKAKELYANAHLYDNLNAKPCDYRMEQIRECERSEAAGRQSIWGMPMSWNSPKDIPADVPIVLCCLNCNAKANLKRCSGCFKAWFCSNECMKKAWPSHKAQCKRWQKELSQPD